jgi:phosphoribosyl 1,2-cyclic phosphodiesterase
MAYGCNTPSIELSRDDGSRLILDAGSGIVGLSNAIVAHPRAVPILLTHYHWDHVQGLPFFAPMFDLDKAPTIHAPEFEDIDPRWVETLFQSPFFPSPKGELLVHCELEFIQAGAHSIGGFDIRAQGLNHPGGAFAYRIRGAHGDLVYATDHELGDPVVDRALGELVGGAHDLILDAHYTPDELVTYAGWGHSSWREAAAFAAEHGVRRLWLFHHKPGRTDDELTEIREAARRIYPSVEIAAEGVSFEV